MAIDGPVSGRPAPGLRPTGSLAFVRRLADKVVADRVTGLAAEVAFWSLLSLVPAALVFAALLGLAQSVLGSDVAARAEARVVEVLDEAFGPGGDGLVRGIEVLFAEPHPGLLSVALLLALWTGSRVVAAVTNALDVIGGVDRRRTWLLRRLWGVALGVGSLLVLTGVLVVLVVLPLGGNTLGGVIAAVFVVAVVVVWLAVLFSVASSHRRRFREQLRGAALAAVLVIVFTIGFRGYLAVQADNIVVFGLGGVLVALLWLYLMGLALLIGAEVNEVLAQRDRATGAGAAYAGGRDDD